MKQHTGQLELPMGFLGLSKAEYHQQWLDQQRRKAYVTGDAVTYFILCMHLGMEPEDKGLFREGQQAKARKDEQKSTTEVIETEEKLSDKSKAEEKSSDNLIARLGFGKKIPYIWGIKQLQLNKLDVAPLKVLFYGMHNLDIYFEMKDALFPDELLAKWYGARVLKQGDSQLKNPRTSILEIITAMDRIAYHKFNGLAERYQSKHPREKDSQQQRIMALPQAVQEAFLESFYAQEKISDADGGMNFHDPNVDGKSRAVYAREIYQKLRANWLDLGRR